MSDPRHEEKVRLATEVVEAVARLFHALLDDHELGPDVVDLSLRAGTIRDELEERSRFQNEGG